VRVLAVVLILLGLAFAGVVVFGLVRHGQGDGTRVAERPLPPKCAAVDAGGGRLTGAPRMAGDEVDEDALEDWSPPNLGQAMACAFAGFAPRVELKPARVDAGANAMAPQTRRIPRDRGAGKDDMRIARLRWQSGAPLLVRHVPPRDDADPQVICLCPPGRTYDEDLFDDCPESWSKRRRTGDGELTCREGDDSGTLVIYREGGAVSFLGLGNPSVALTR